MLHSAEEGGGLGSCVRGETDKVGSFINQIVENVSNM